MYPSFIDFYTHLKDNIKHFQTLGNHEFDLRIAGLVPFLETVKSPVVVANLDDSKEPTMQGKYNKAIVIERSGRKIGVIGAVTSTTEVNIFVFPRECLVPEIKVTSFEFTETI